MRNTLPAFIILAVVVTGCGSPGTVEGAPTPTPTRPAVQTMSTAESCEEIAPNGGDGILTEAVDFAVAATEDDDLDSAVISDARDLVDKLDPIIETASINVREDLEKVADFPRGIVESIDSGKSSLNLDPTDFKAGASALADRCMASDAVVAAPEPTVTSPLAEELKEEFPGYPLIVDVSSLDYRVANAFTMTGHTGKVVAVIPGVYAAYNPNIPNLDKYYEGPFYGDSMMAKEYLQGGGSYWGGVLPGTQEPQG